MKKLFLILTVLVLTSFSYAGEYKVDPVHSSVGFQIRHFVSKVNGEFREYQSTFNFDEKNLKSSNVSFTVETKSIDTRNEKRDEHLRSADFFDVEKFSTASFHSKKITSSGKNKYKLAGDFTLHGVTKPVTFDVEYGGSIKDFEGHTRVGFSASAKINRKDYGISWNKILDKGGLALGEDVLITLQIEAPEVKK